MLGLATANDLLQLQEELGKIRHRLTELEHATQRTTQSSLKSQVGDLESRLIAVEQAVKKLQEDTSPFVRVTSISQPAITISFEEVVSRVREALKTDLEVRDETVHQIVDEKVDQLLEEGDYETLADKVYEDIDTELVTQRLAELLKDQVAEQLDRNELIEKLVELVWDDDYAIDIDWLREAVAEKLVNRLQLREVDSQT